MVDDNLTIPDCPVSRDVLNLFWGKEEYCVGPIGDTWFALCQLMHFFAHCQCLEMLEVGIVLQFFVLCHGLLGDRMDNAAAVLLDVNEGPSPLQIGGNLKCLKSHDVIGIMMVFDVVATLGGVAIPTLGGGSVSTLGDLGRGGGNLSWPDIIVESWQIVGRCLSLALAIVGIVCPSCSKRLPPQVRFCLAQMQQGLGNGQGTAATCPQSGNTKLMGCRTKYKGSGCLPGQCRNRQLHAAPRRLLLRDRCKPVLLSQEGQDAFY